MATPRSVFWFRAADERVFINKRGWTDGVSLDGELLPRLKDVLSDGVEKRFIVVHLIGTHTAYDLRFPAEFGQFTTEAGLNDRILARRELAHYLFRGSRIELSNAYDNAVLYNDQVVKKRSGPEPKRVHESSCRFCSAMRASLTLILSSAWEIEPDRLLDNLGREAIAAIAELGHHQWLRLKVADAKPNDDVTRPTGESLPKTKGKENLIHLSLGPDEQVGTMMVGFNKRINVTPKSLTDVKDAPCRDFSPRWKTANRGVNNLAGTRSMSKIAGLAMGGVHISALHSPIQSARKLLRMR
jgi:hypothetical protein